MVLNRFDTDGKRNGDQQNDHGIASVPLKNGILHRRQRKGDREPEGDEQQHVHQHLTVHFLLLFCLNERLKRLQDQPLFAGVVSQDGDIQDSPQRHDNQRQVAVFCHAGMPPRKPPHQQRPDNDGKGDQTPYDRQWQPVDVPEKRVEHIISFWEEV